jgi:hypothetical protein
MEEQLISFDVAKLAKEKGFTWHNISHYNHAGSSEYRSCYNEKEIFIRPKVYNPKNSHYPCCNQSLLQKWLRDIHNINVISYPIILEKNHNPVECTNLTYTFWIINKGIMQYISTQHEYHSYEESLEVALQEALKLI